MSKVLFKKAQLFLILKKSKKRIKQIRLFRIKGVLKTKRVKLNYKLRKKVVRGSLTE